MHIRLLVNDNYEDDVEQLSHHPIFGRSIPLLRAFIDELENNQSALKILNRTDDSYHSPLFSVKWVRTLQDNGYNIYRIRPLEKLGHFRILIAYDCEEEDFYILALVLKKPDDTTQIVEGFEEYYYDYKISHPRSQRAIAEYDAMELRKIS